MNHYAVIGNPIAHSKSPQIHSAFAQQEGVVIDYQRILSSEEDFIVTVNKFKQHDGSGVNVTVPFKVSAYQQCAELNEYAKAAKAVNTISFAADGSWIGANTDGIGLLRDLKSNLNVAIKNKRVLVLGAGGAARGILLPLLQERPKCIFLVNRTFEKAEQLAKEFSSNGLITSCRFNELGNASFDIIINATSASLANEVPPISAATLNQDTLCYDLAYSDTDTAFLTWAQSHSVKLSSDGLGMLIEQAAESYFIWRGFRPDTASVITLLRPAS